MRAGAVAQSGRRAATSVPGSRHPRRLNRNAGNVAIRAKHATIAGYRFEPGAAASANVEELAGIHRHCFRRAVLAARAGDHRYQLNRARRIGRGFCLSLHLSAPGSMRAGKSASVEGATASTGSAPLCGVVIRISSIRRSRLHSVATTGSTGQEHGHENADDRQVGGGCRGQPGNRPLLRTYRPDAGAGANRGRTSQL